jgi:phosphoglycolate phosphatase-like HAD superfamily hydrolase
MAIERSRIQALCFDVDGTLHDTDDQFVLKLVGWLRPFRFLLPQRDALPLARWVVMNTESPANLMYGIPDRLGLDDELARLGDWLYEKGLGKKAHPYRLIEGVAEALQRLSLAYPMSVVSARGDRNTRHFLETFDIQKYFQVIVTGQTCRHSKPSPEPILYAANQMKVPAEACLMIGDTTVDIQAGKAAGAQTVGVLCGFGMERELHDQGADLILSSTSEIAKILLD